MIRSGIGMEGYDRDTSTDRNAMRSLAIDDACSCLLLIAQRSEMLPICQTYILSKSHILIPTVTDERNHTQIMTDMSFR